MLKTLRFPTRRTLLGTVVAGASMAPLAFNTSLFAFAEEHSLPELSQAVLDPALSVSIAPQMGTTPVGIAGVTFQAVASDFPLLNLNASSITDPAWSEVVYVWRFTNVSGGFSNIVKMLPEWNDRSVAHGPFVGMAFPVGSYTATLTAMTLDGTRYNQASYSFTVAPADEVYAGQDVICVCADAGDALAGAQHVTTLAGAVSAGRNRARCMILLHAGESFAVDSVRLESLPNIHIDRYGTGEAPILQTVMGDSKALEIRYDYNTGKSDSISNVDIRGPWNELDETPRDNGFPPGGIDLYSPFIRLALRNVTFNGIKNALTLLGNHVDTSGQLVLDNCKITNFQNYGFFSSDWAGTALAIFGTSIYDGPNASMGGLGRHETNGFGKAQGPFRTSGIGRAYVGVSYTLSRGGWTRVGAVPSAQPNFRFEASFANINMDRILAVGGSPQVKVGLVSTGSARQPVNFVIDRAMLVTSCRSAANFSVERGGVHGRNIVGIIANVDERTNSYRGFLGLNIADLAERPDEADNTAGGMVFYSCTFVDLTNDTNGDGDLPFVASRGSLAAFTTQIEDNIVTVSPNKASPDASFEPVLLQATGIDPEWLGLKYQPNPSDPDGQVTMDTAWATPADSIVIPIPQPTSTAVQTAASGLVAPLDFFGNPRRNQLDQGAVLSTYMPEPI